MDLSTIERPSSHIHHQPRLEFDGYFRIKYFNSLHQPPDQRFAVFYLLILLIEKALHFLNPFLKLPVPSNLCEKSLFLIL